MRCVIQYFPISSIDIEFSFSTKLEDFTITLYSIGLDQSFPIPHCHYKTRNHSPISQTSPSARRPLLFMTMESLANELLLDVFEYLSTMDIFQSFTNLNHRFDNLIVDYFHIRKSVDFRLGSTKEIQSIRRKYLPSFIDQIERLHLSNADTSPHQIEIFLSRLCPLYRFENLKTMTLECLHSFEALLKLLGDCQRLSHLTELNLHQCSIQADQQSILKVMDSIWSLPHLITLDLDMSFNNHNHFIPPRVISCSIRHLIIKGVQCLVGNLSLLYENTPSLESLSLKLWNPYDDEHQLTRMPTLTKFSCQCDDSSVSFATLLRQMPNLSELRIQTQNIRLDGKAWETIISKHLLLLQHFHLQMEIPLDNEDDIEGEVDQLMNTYRTRFWIDEHQWFIRCFWNEDSDAPHLYLHTLPYPFHGISLELGEHFRTKSTCDNNDSEKDYNRVNTLTYSSTGYELTEIWRISFAHLRHLSLTFPLDLSFHSHISDFKQLLSLTIRIVDWSDENEDLAQIQEIVDQAPHLFSLKFHSWPSSLTNPGYPNRKINQKNSSKMPPFSIRSSSVRQLDLRGLTTTGADQYYNDQQCTALIRSPLGSQCEYLEIDVEKRSSVVDFIKKMPQLRTLNVRCRDGKPNDQELIKWLKDRLPSAYSLAKDPRFPDRIQLWT